MKLYFRPWIYFCFFLISNTLLSYLPLAFEKKLWILAFGLLIPFLIAFWIILEKRFKEPSPEYVPIPTLITISKDPAPPFSLWLIFIAFVLLTRLYKLDSIPSWLIGDEGQFATMAISVMNKWDWTLLWPPGRMEPLLIWLMGPFFRITPPSLTSLRLFTAIISITTVLLTYSCIRPFLPRSTSFIFAWFFAFSFWEFTFMRFCTPEDLINLFMILNLGCLGYFLKSKKPIYQQLWMTALIGCNIFGFYSYINWVVIWFFVLFSLILLSFQQPDIKKSTFYFFLITTISILPLVFARLSPGGVTYLKSSMENVNFLDSIFSYFKNIFYDSKNSYPYAPDWGGMF